ncbi:MAG TPA: M28 family peptidase [Candidatus Krumholzibacteria bacterium]|nr:M28 family peptidase [Candidatus Krumholzibacteria bacterium]
MVRRSLVIGCLSVLVAAPARSAEPASSSTSEATFLSHTRQLTFEGKRAGEAYFSPDGKRIIFQAEREADNPFYQIYILSLETGDVTRVSPGTGKTTCSWFHPTEDRVIFASTHLDPDAVAKQKQEFQLRADGKQRRYAWDYDETYDIFTSKPDGSDMKRLTDAVGYDAECSYSPDGSMIVFASNRAAYPLDKLSKKDQDRAAVDLSYFCDIYTMKADGSDVKRLTTAPGYDGGPFFAPDGKRIVWREFTEDGMQADVYSMAVDGSDVKRITDFGAMSWAPYFHPSGDYLVFTSNILGFDNFELYIVDADGKKEPVRITRTDGFDGLPVFSPDGTKLMWTSNRTSDKQSQIFIADWNDAAARDALGKALARNVHTGVDQGKAVFRAPLERNAKAQVSFAPEIRAGDMKNDVTYLASDELEGRFTGSKGEQAAGAYIVKRFQEAGLQALGEKGYYQPFPFTSGVKLVAKENAMTVKAADGDHTLQVDKDFRPLAFSENASVEGPVAFVGYGLKTPGTGADAYDSYGDFDVKDKVVFVLAYVPESVSVDRRMHLNMYSGLRYKATIAREHGARALIVVTGPTSPNAGTLMPLGFDQSLAGSGIPVVSVTGNVADMLFKSYGKTLKEVQEQLDVENPHAEGAFDLTGVTAGIATKVEREHGTGHNVIAYLPAGTDTPDTPVLVVGAHYDHLGRGNSNSLARKGEENQIHNGADDNASGTSTVLELAQYLSQQRDEHPELFPYGIVFATWSGEELGIIGSSYFVEHPTIPRERMLAYLNFDMVGRMKDNTLIMQGTGSSDVWKGLIEKGNVAAGFNIKTDDDPYLPTDVTAFYPKHIPVIAFFTGSHEDYHRPTDDADKIDYADMERVGKFAAAMIMNLEKSDSKPSYLEVAQSKEQQGSRANMRVALGTIPDYSGGDIEGVKLSGVRAGGPADQAGIQGGDIIVELAGKPIKNIYDYTYTMDALKIGEAVPVVVLRDGKRVSLTITPQARQ